MKNKTTIHRIAGLAALLAIPSSVHAVTVSTPVNFDFGTGPGQEDINDPGSDFTVTIVDDGTLGEFNTLANSLQMVNNVNAYTNMSATVATDLSVASQSSFLMTTTLTLENSGGDGFTRPGLVFFGNGGVGLSAVIMANNNQIRFRSGLDDGLQAIYATTNVGGWSDGGIYDLSVTGNFLANGDLEAVFSVDEVGGNEISASVSHTFTAAFLDDLDLGNEFGVIGRIRNGLDVRYDDLSIIPEPTTALLGGLGFLMLLRRRR